VNQSELFRVAVAGGAYLCACHDSIMAHAGRSCRRRAPEPTRSGPLKSSAATWERGGLLGLDMRCLSNATSRS
jgi:hypothetical protein